MEIWSHNGKLYEVNAYYSLPDDAWQYELVGLSGAPGTGPYLTLVIPDAAPDDGPFTPKHADHVLVAVDSGQTPWPVLRRLLDLVESSGDIAGEHQASPTGSEEIVSNNVWWHDGKRFEVNAFHFSDRDAWCYELYEVTADRQRNDYVEVQIPDTHPANGPFVSDSVDRMTFTAHGEQDIPWPIFRRFIEAIEAAER